MSSDTDLGDNELEDMLNEGLPDDIKNRKTEQQYDEKFKTVLEGNRYRSNRLILLIQILCSIVQRRAKITLKFFQKAGYK